MNEQKRKIGMIVARVGTVALSVLWLFFIFSNSLKSGEESGEQSSRVHEIVNEVTQSIGIKQEISQSSIRTFAHFIEFAILGVLVCAIILSYRLFLSGRGERAGVLRFFAALPPCALCAGIDEWLQTFFEGRAAQLTDWFIDTSGALTGCAAFAGGILLLRVLRQKKKEKHDRDSDPS